MSRTCLIAAFAIVSCAGLANADTYTLRYDGHGDGRTVNYSTDSGAHYNGTFAGEFRWFRTGSTPSIPNGEMSTFCIQLTESNPSVGSSETYTLVDPANAPDGANMGADRRNLMNELFGRYFATLDLNNDDQCAAFQISVWEIVYDSGVALNGGSFRVQNGGSWYSTAQTWLNSLDGTGPMATTRALTNGSRQDHIIPTPGAAALAGLGLLAVGRRRR